MVNNIIWGIVLITGLAILSLPTVLILTIGMIPSAVAYFCDKSDEKYTALCIGALNLCGVFPYLLKIWFDNHSISNAVEIIFNPFPLMIMYMGAGLGWALYVYVPPIISVLIEIISKHRLAHLNDVQANLVNQWGVLGTSERTKPNLEIGKEKTSISRN